MDATSFVKKLVSKLNELINMSSVNSNKNYLNTNSIPSHAVSSSTFSTGDELSSTSPSYVPQKGLSFSDYCTIEGTSSLSRMTSPPTQRMNQNLPTMTDHNDNCDELSRGDSKRRILEDDDEESGDFKDLCGSCASHPRVNMILFVFCYISFMVFASCIFALTEKSTEVALKVNMTMEQIIFLRDNPSVEVHSLNKLVGEIVKLQSKGIVWEPLSPEFVATARLKHYSTESPSVLCPSFDKKTARNPFPLPRPFASRNSQAVPSQNLVFPLPSGYLHERLLHKLKRSSFSQPFPSHDSPSNRFRQEEEMPISVSSDQLEDEDYIGNRKIVEFGNSQDNKNVFSHEPERNSGDEEKELIQLQRQQQPQRNPLSVPSLVSKEGKAGTGSLILDQVVYQYSEQLLRNMSYSIVSAHNWEFSSSLLFVTSLVTTIGYGHITPMTQTGRFLSIAFSGVGIPMTLTLLSAFSMMLLRSPMRRMETQLAIWATRLTSKASVLLVRLTHLLILTIFLTVVCLLIPAAIFDSVEKDWTYLDAVYYCYISLTTIGLGDFIPAVGGPHLSYYRLGTVAYLYIGLTFIMLWLALIYRIPQLNLNQILLSSDPSLATTPTSTFPSNLVSGQSLHHSKKSREGMRILSKKSGSSTSGSNSKHRKRGQYGSARSEDEATPSTSRSSLSKSYGTTNITTPTSP